MEPSTSETIRKSSLPDLFFGKHFFKSLYFLISFTPTPCALVLSSPKILFFNAFSKSACCVSVSSVMVFGNEISLTRLDLINPINLLKSVVSNFTSVPVKTTFLSSHEGSFSKTSVILTFKPDDTIVIVFNFGQASKNTNWSTVVNVSLFISSFSIEGDLICEY